MIGTSFAFSIERGDIPAMQNYAEHGPRPMLNGIPFNHLLDCKRWCLAMKTCPVCHEEIHDDAIKCRYCHTVLVHPDQGSPEQEPNKFTYVVDKGIVTFLKIAAGMLFLMLGITAFTFGFDFSRGRTAVQEAVQETTETSEQLSGMVDYMKTKLAEMEGLSQKFGSHSTAMEQHIRHMDVLAKRAEFTTRKLERSFETFQARLATLEDVLATVEKRTKDVPAEGESLASRMQSRFFSEHRESVVTVGIPSFAHVGAGVIVTSSGYIITADYVVTNVEIATITLSTGTELLADVIVVDDSIGLALLRVRISKDGVTPRSKATFQYLPLADEMPKVGDPVVAIGTSALRALRSGEGIVTSIDDEWLTVKFSDSTAGYGGGPVLDENGKTVGIVYQGDARNVDQCKRSDQILAFMRDHGVTP